MELKLILLLGCMVYVTNAATKYMMGASFTENINGGCDCMKYEVYCQQPSNDHHYYMRAIQHCRSRSILPLGPKGRLAVLKDPLIASKVVQFIRAKELHKPPCINKYGFWIGLSDRAKEGKFVWSDGKALCSDDDANWAPGQPDNTQTKKTSGQDCVQLWFRNGYEGQLDDEYCDFRPKGFICEIPDPHCLS
ncbi:perlucin-like protein [Ptychodera flava]|uniref:perlucin-like protein n=1 Tax=Ptychodera flava TaxID=63121 RepID=UPI00396A2607